MAGTVDLDFTSIDLSDTDKLASTRSTGSEDGRSSNFATTLDPGANSAHVGDKLRKKKEEELQRKRRNDEVAKARMMMEIVSDKERKELEALFPELLRSSPEETGRTLEGESEDGDDLLPKAFVFMGPSLVETTLSGGEGDLDFGLAGCRVSFRDFVGFREIHSFSAVPALPATFVPTHNPTPVERATVLATALGESLKDTWQWIADMKPLGLSLPSPQGLLPPSSPVVLRGGGAESPPASQPGQSWPGHDSSPETLVPHRDFFGEHIAGYKPAVQGSGTPDRLHDISSKVMSSSPELDATNGNTGFFLLSAIGGDGVGVGGRSPPAPAGSSEVGYAGPGTGENGAEGHGVVPATAHKWQIVWKDSSKLGAPIRRLEFCCNAAGLDAVREKLNRWHLMAQSAAAMLEASQAAIKACGGSVPENPGVWLPPGLPESAAVYLAALSQQSEGPAQADARGDQEGNAPRGGENGVGEEEWAEQEEAAGTSGGAVAEDGARMSAAELEALGVAEGDNVVRWGSVAVEGRVMPKRVGDSLLLRPGHYMAITAALPARLRAATWHLIYSTARDGISLKTLYRKSAARRGPCLLFVRDSRKFVFGCFTSEEWKPATRYYGNGECFVFQVQPELRAFRWTHANSYFMFSTPASLAIGGGNHYAFSLNSDLLSGFSAPCETFGSTLLSGSDEYEAVLVEVWSLRSGLSLLRG